MTMQPHNNPTVEELSRQEVRRLEQKGRRAVQKKVNTLQHLEVMYVPIDSVFPNSYNPNRQSERDFELLISSMMEDGFTQPILVHQQSNEIVDGEHRWRAANRIGLKEIPVVFVDMTEEQMRISTLRHNRARGSEDVELTIKMLQDLRELGALDHAVSSLGISDKELNALIADTPAPEAMAAQSYSQAWVPKPDVMPEAVINMKGQIVTKTASIHKYERQMDQKVEEEEPGDTYMRQDILAHMERPSKLIAIFRKADVQIISDVLQDKPAQRLIALAKYHCQVSGIDLSDLAGKL